MEHIFCNPATSKRWWATRADLWLHKKQNVTRVMFTKANESDEFFKTYLASQLSNFPEFMLAVFAHWWIPICHKEAKGFNSFMSDFKVWFNTKDGADIPTHQIKNSNYANFRLCGCKRKIGTKSQLSKYLNIKEIELILL